MRLANLLSRRRLATSLADRLLDASLVEPVGWWVGGTLQPCCRLPDMPVGVPQGVWWHCPTCYGQWTWLPAKAS